MLYSSWFDVNICEKSRAKTLDFVDSLKAAWWRLFHMQNNIYGGIFVMNV